MIESWGKINECLAKSREKYRFYLGDYDYPCFDNGRMAAEFPKQRVGWGKRAVEIRANKTKFDRFENDTLGLNELFEEYQVIQAFNKIKEDVLVCGCGFLAVSDDRVFPFTAEEATGNFSWRNQNLKDGVAVFRPTTKKNAAADSQAPDAFIEYLTDETIIHEAGAVRRIANGCNRPLMGLLTHKSTAKRPFGRSVLTKTARSAMEDASRTIRQAMIAAHHYNTKVDVILGADNETPVDKIESRTGDVLKIGTNENGQIPQIGEFAQHAMTPFSDTILVAARSFCSETDLNLANLSISTDAPQSKEALEIINDDLRDSILAWQDELGQQLKYFGVTLWMHKEKIKELDDNALDKIRKIKPVFMSIYRQDVSKFGDGLMKIAEKAPEIVKSRTIWHGLGLTSEEIDNVISSIDKV